MTGSRHERGYGSRWDKLRKKILARDKGLCQHCLDEGLYREATDVDHITRKKDGGDDSPTNLQSLCKAHHIAKTRTENAGREVLASGCSVNGLPTDRGHHWHGGSGK